mgnify:CR=1 FL=1
MSSAPDNPRHASAPACNDCRDNFPLPQALDVFDQMVVAGYVERRTACTACPAAHKPCLEPAAQGLPAVELHTARSPHAARPAQPSEPARRSNPRHAYELNRQRIAQLWSEARPIVEGDAGNRYLQRQGVTSPAPDTLRLHPALEYWHNDHSGRAACLGTFPALLAALQIDVHPHGLFKPAVRHTVALQRFYLTARGTPAPVPVFTKATGTDGHIKGAAVRLSAPRVQADGVVLGVAVGLVSALRFAAALRMPVWAVSDPAALAHFRWPRGVTHLHVFTDSSDAAHAVPACELARKAARCGLTCYVQTITPPRALQPTKTAHPAPNV